MEDVLTRDALQSATVMEVGRGKMMVEKTVDGFSITLEGRVVLRHRASHPSLFVGHGQERMDMYRGNFEVED